MFSPFGLIRKRALLLDFGGTLVHEVPGRSAIYAEEARAAGLDVDPGTMARHMQAALDSLPIEVEGGGFRYTRPWFERFIDHVFVEQLGVSRGTLPRVKSRLFERFADASTFQVFPDVRPLLRTAEGLGLQIAIVSNWSDSLDALVRALDIGRFNAILSSGIERIEKPDPALFDRALARIGVAPDEALHVGDSLANDVVGAGSAGIDAVLLDRSGASVEPPEPPYRVVPSLLDVRTMIRFAP